MAISEPSVYDKVDLEPYRAAVEEILGKGNLKLPVLPEVVRDLLALNADATIETRELYDLVHRDLTLAGHVLRVSNSAIYAGTRKIASLNQAIVRLGRRALVKIAVSITMQGVLFQVPGFKSEMKAMAEHALTTGAYAQEIGSVMGADNDELYMCGLLHGVGKPVLLQAFVELKKAGRVDFSPEVMQHLMNEYHGEVGFRLASEWKLPQAVRLACLYSKNYSQAPEEHHALMITYLATQFASRLLGNEEKENDRFWSDPVFNDLGCTTAQKESLIQARESVEEIVEMISVTI